LVFTITVFVKLKSLIPLINPFAFDPAFESLDRALHFGQQPWELLQGLLGYEWITLFIQRLYYAWFPVFLLTYYWQLSTRKDPVVRQQFLLSFVACWALIGTLMAIAFSSAGPIYYAEIVPDDPDVYAKPMEYLLGIHADHPMVMFDIKQILWDGYTGTSPNADISGISAMPSMHVSLAFLMMLFGWKQGKWFATAYTAFFVYIALGSVHLLWHYAVDGYVSIIATFLIWKASGWIAKRSVASAERIEGTPQTA